MSQDSLGELLYDAAKEGDVEKCRTLLQQGAPVNWRDYKYNWTSLIAACRYNKPSVMDVLLVYKADVNIQTKCGNTALHMACYHGHTECVQLVTATGQCDLGIMNFDGKTALGEAVYAGKLSVVKHLVNDCNVDVNDPINKFKDTPLGLAVKEGKFSIVKNLVTQFSAKAEDLHLILALKRRHMKIFCYLLVECHCDPNIKDKDGCTPLSLAQDKTTIQLLLQHGAIAQDVYTEHRKTLGKIFSKDPLKNPVKMFVIGHCGAGKSTLIKALEHEPTFWTSLANIFIGPKEVEGVDQSTAGIIPRTFKSRYYGDVQFYDFAGQEAYYSSHAAVIKSAVDKSSPIFLFVIDFSKEDTAITQSVSYWLGIIANQCGSMEGKAPLIVVGSHIDLVNNDSKVERKKRITSEAVKKFPDFNLIQIVPIDCRFSTSNGINTLRQSVRINCESIRVKLAVSLNSHMLLIYLFDNYPNEVAIILEELQQKVKQDTAQEISKKHKQTLSFVPTTIPHLVEICVQLSDKGHILFLHNTSSPDKSFIIIDKTKLLGKINGTMFAPENFKQHCKIATSTGIVPQSRLAAHFPEIKMEVLIGLLSHFELAIPIEDKEVLKLINKNLTSTCEFSAEGYLFCPALIRLEVAENACKFESDLPYRLSYIVICSYKDDFFNPRFLHVLFLRIALSLNFAPVVDPDFPALQRQCSVWKTGVSWSTTDNIKVFVEVVNKKKVIVLMQAQAPSSELFKLRSAMVNKVVETVKQLCPSVVTDEVILSPSSMTYPPIDFESTPVFSLKSVAESILANKTSVVSTSGIERLPTCSLFEAYANLDENILHPLFNENDPAHNTKISDRFLSALSSSWNKNPHLVDIICSAIAKETKPTPNSCANLESALKLWRNVTRASYKNLRQLLDPLSVFAGRNPLELAGVSPKVFSEELLPHSQLTVTQPTSSVGGGLTIEHLKRRTGVTDTQLDTEIIEHDLQPLADCFDNIDTYLYQLGLSAGQQTDIKDQAFHRGTQSAMREALRLWREPNPYAATFRALINITLELRKGVVADKLCKYTANKVPAADNFQ